METDSSSGICDNFRGFQEDQRQLRHSYMLELSQGGVVKLRKVAEVHNPSDILATCVKTEALLRHIHRFNMITTRDGVFNVAAIFIESVQGVSRRANPCGFECFPRRCDHRFANSLLRDVRCRVSERYALRECFCEQAGCFRDSDFREEGRLHGEGQGVVGDVRRSSHRGEATTLVPDLR